MMTAGNWWIRSGEYEEREPRLVPGKANSHLLAQVRPPQDSFGLYISHHSSGQYLLCFAQIVGQFLTESECLCVAEHKKKDFKSICFLFSSRWDDATV